MNKNIFLNFIILVFLCFTSCNNSEENKINNEIINESVPETITDSILINTESISDDLKNNKIDYDLSKMNYNMLSAAIFDMMVDPDKYTGKRIKASGNFESSIYEGTRYYSLLIWDSAGCCPAGFDFTPPADMKYPEDFPEEDSKITIVCIFNHTEINGQDYFMFDVEEIN